MRSTVQFSPRAVSNHDAVTGDPKTLAPQDRSISELEQQIGPTLHHIAPELRDEILDLAETGKPKAAEDELLEFVVSDNPSILVHQAVSKRSARDEWKLRDKLYLFVLVPAALALYCIFSVLFTGKILF